MAEEAVEVGPVRRGLQAVTDEILREAGYSGADIAAMRADKVA